MENSFREDVLLEKLKMCVGSIQDNQKQNTPVSYQSSYQPIQSKQREDKLMDYSKKHIEDFNRNRKPDRNVDLYARNSFRQKHFDTENKQRQFSGKGDHRVCQPLAQLKTNEMLNTNQYKPSQFQTKDESSLEFKSIRQKYDSNNFQNSFNHQDNAKRRSTSNYQASNFNNQLQREYMTYNINQSSSNKSKQFVAKRYSNHEGDQSSFKKYDSLKYQSLRSATPKNIIHENPHYKRSDKKYETNQISSEPLQIRNRSTNRLQKYYSKGYEKSQQIDEKKYQINSCKIQSLNLKNQNRQKPYQFQPVSSREYQPNTALKKQFQVESKIEKNQQKFMKRLKMENEIHCEKEASTLQKLKKISDLNQKINERIKNIINVFEKAKY